MQSWNNVALTFFLSFSLVFLFLSWTLSSNILRGWGKSVSTKYYSQDLVGRCAYTPVLLWKVPLLLKLRRWVGVVLTGWGCNYLVFVVNFNASAISPYLEDLHCSTQEQMETWSISPTKICASGCFLCSEIARKYAEGVHRASVPKVRIGHLHSERPHTHRRREGGSLEIWKAL